MSCVNTLDVHLRNSIVVNEVVSKHRVRGRERELNMV